MEQRNRRPIVPPASEVHQLLPEPLRPPPAGNGSAPPQPPQVPPPTEADDPAGPHSSPGQLPPSRRQPSAQTASARSATVADPDSEDDPTDVLDRYAAARIDWGDLWDRDLAAPDWLVEPLLPEGRAVATYSPAGSGKSLLALDVAARAATGRRCLDRPASDPLNVVYFDLEMTEDDLHERLDEMGYGPDHDLSHLAYYLLPDLPPLDTAAGGTEIRALSTVHDADLVIIDTTSSALHGPENDSDTLRAFHRHTGQFLKADGRTVWRLDHAGKDLTRGQRGTSAKNDDVDVVWQLRERDRTTIRLKATKRRLSWVPHTVDVVRLDGPLRHELTPRSWPSGTHDLVEALDRLDVPTDWGRRKAAQALRDAGETCRNEIVMAAVRFRRQRTDDQAGPVSGTGPDRGTGNARDQTSGPEPKTPSDQAGPVHGTGGDRSPRSDGSPTHAPRRGAGGTQTGSSGTPSEGT